MAKLECMRCGAPVEATEAGRKDGRLIFHLNFTCDCQVLRPREQQAEDAFWEGFETSNRAMGMKAAAVVQAIQELREAGYNV